MIVQICPSPDAHGVQDGQNRLSEFRQLIFYSRRHNRIDMPLHQAVFFQLSQLLCQHLWRHLRHQLLQLSEPQRAICQMIQNQCLPLSPINPSVASMGQSYGISLVSCFIRIPPSAVLPFFAVFYRHQNHSHLPKSAVLFLSHRSGTILIIPASPSIVSGGLACTLIITPDRGLYKFYPLFYPRFSCSFPASACTG